MFKNDFFTDFSTNRQQRYRAIVFDQLFITLFKVRVHLEQQKRDQFLEKIYFLSLKKLWKVSENKKEIHSDPCMGENDLKTCKIALINVSMYYVQKLV